MRFMMLMLPGEKAEREGFFATPEMFAAMATYNEALADAGVMLSGEGLLPSAKGARISFAGGKPTVTDGPFTEAREVLGGYWIIQVNSREDAIAWASRCPAADDEIIELRQVAELTDFPEEIVNLIGERETALTARLAQA